MRSLLVVLALLAGCSKLVDLRDVLPPSCGDEQHNGGESDVDCGGPCDPCVTGEACASGTDCLTGLCQAMVCQAPACTDGIENGDETDLDCGGSCDPCATGKACARDA